MQHEQKERDAQRDRDLQMQREQKDRDLQLLQAKQEHELLLAKQDAEIRIQIAQLQASQPPVTTFRVDSAAKLLPKLINEHEIETYILTFEKIAALNKWPKDSYSAILQTQLKGKCLKVFSELSDADCQNWDKLKPALTAAFEISAEQHREKFRALIKTTGESFA